MGSHLMAEAGYNPLELAHFFEKLNTGQLPPEFLSDHPNPDHREYYGHHRIGHGAGDRRGHDHGDVPGSG